MVIAVFALALIIPKQTYAQTDAFSHIMRITQPGDSKLNCLSISSEISEMDTIILEAEEKKRNTRVAGTGFGVAQTVGSFMVGSLGGVLGIFAAGAIIDNAADNKVEKVQEIQNAAAQRRSLMAALYDTRECFGPLAQEMALIEPAAGEEIGGDLLIGPPDLRLKPVSYND